MNTPTIPAAHKRRLQAHFGFTGLPFRKNFHAQNMFDSTSQRELGHGLNLWTEIRGLALVTGATGVGKSIGIRRFVGGLDEARYHVVRFGQVPTTPAGFLRSLCRVLDLPMRRHTADLFDAARAHLNGYADVHAAHPVLVLDDAEGMRVDALDLLRRLTHWDLDAADHFSVLVVGTEAVLDTLRAPQLASLRSRFSYAAQLRPFTIEDTRNYVRFHLQTAGVADTLFSDDAVREIFLASGGAPRAVNQLALQALISAAVQGRDTLDGPFVGRLVAAHPLYARGER